MTSDDVLRYREYIGRQRYRVKQTHHVELTHFVIVASGFRGSTTERIRQLQQDGVVPSLVCADLIASARRMIHKLDYPDVQLVDLRRFFCGGVIGQAALHNCFCHNTCVCLQLG
jgi:hypothetical protein